MNAPRPTLAVLALWAAPLAALPLPPVAWQAGDLLACGGGGDAANRAVAAADPGARHTHVALVAPGPQGAWLALEAIPHRPGSDGQPAPAGVVAWPLGEWFARQDGRVDVLRWSSPEQAATAAAWAAARLGTPFDFAFDHTGTARLYCTELVWAAFRAAGADLTVNPRPFALAWARVELLYPSDLTAAPGWRPAPEKSPPPAPETR